MRSHPSLTVRSRLGVEDILLAVLGLIAGPLLCWMAQMWQRLPTASSIQTLEYWIAIVCGFVGITLCVLWFLFFIAGLSFFVGLKTRNKFVLYWSELFTPKFLRRIIISVFGAQLALTSPAFAVPTDSETAGDTVIDEPEPFMPHVHEPTTRPTRADEYDSPTPLAEKHQPTGSPSTAPSISTTAPPASTPEPRQHSEVEVRLEPTASYKSAEELTPTPRQTSTVIIEQQPEQASQTPNTNNEYQTFSPRQPVPSPYIAAPNQARDTADPTLVVKSGDCLWDIAHQELGADATLFQIDQRWRQWWQHNREIIGDDPHALSPGSVLQAPPFTQ